MIKEIIKLNLHNKTKILENELLKNHTTFGIGGPVKLIICPYTLEDLVKILQYIKKNNIESYFIGSGSNILANDNGFNGIVISLKKSMNKILFLDKHIHVEAGAMLGTMVKKAISKSYKGLESLIGVPGTVGGALIMNAGAHGSEISELLIEARTINKKGDVKKYLKNDILFSYRNSTFPKDEILIDATFKIKKGNKKDITFKKITVSDKRKSTQPLKYRSAGSIFKNPKNNFAAGYLIDKTGLKGLRLGDAEISKKHANFIINHGKAKFNDVIKLINIAKTKVYKEFNVKLELEVKILGNQLC